MKGEWDVNTQFAIEGETVTMWCVAQTRRKNVLLRQNSVKGVAELVGHI